MAVTLRITEGEPDYYPRIVTEDDPAIEREIEPAIRRKVNAAWQRVESYIRYRWNVRSVEYVVEGPGEWTPDLSPTTITTIETWRNDAWEAVMLRPSAFGGYILDFEGPYRFT